MRFKAYRFEIELGGDRKPRRRKEASMEPTKADSTPTLLLWIALIAVGHFIVFLWHLFLVVKLQPDFPRSALPLMILVNLFPVAGLVALAKGLAKWAGCMITLPLAIVLVIGTYAHFLSPGADNILRMPPAGLRLPFQISAVLLALLEALGCWFGIRIFVRMPAQRALKM